MIMLANETIVRWDGAFRTYVTPTRPAQVWSQSSVNVAAFWCHFCDHVSNTGAPLACRSVCSSYQRYFRAS